MFTIGYSEPTAVIINAEEGDRVFLDVDYTYAPAYDVLAEKFRVWEGYRHFVGAVPTDPSLDTKPTLGIHRVCFCELRLEGKTTVPFAVAFREVARRGLVMATFPELLAFAPTAQGVRRQVCACGTVVGIGDSGWGIQHGRFPLISVSGTDERAYIDFLKTSYGTFGEEVTLLCTDPSVQP